MHFREDILGLFWPSDAELTHLLKILLLGRLKEGGKGDNRGQVGWMASLTQWT